MQFSHQFCVVTSIHSECGFIIIRFQQIYRFEVDLLKKFSMSLLLSNLIMLTLLIFVAIILTLYSEGYTRAFVTGPIVGSIIKT